MSLYLVQIIVACPDYKRPSADIYDPVVCENMDDAIEIIICKFVGMMIESEFTGQSLSDYAEQFDAYMEMPIIEARVYHLHDKILNSIYVNNNELFEQAVSRYRETDQYKELLGEGED